MEEEAVHQQVLSTSIREHKCMYSCGNRSPNYWSKLLICQTVSEANDLIRHRKCVHFTENLHSMAGEWLWWAQYKLAHLPDQDEMGPNVRSLSFPILLGITELAHDDPTWRNRGLPSPCIGSIVIICTCLRLGEKFRIYFSFHFQTGFVILIQLASPKQSIQ